MRNENSWDIELNCQHCITHLTKVIITDLNFYFVVRFLRECLDIALKMLHLFLIISIKKHFNQQ